MTTAPHPQTTNGRIVRLAITEPTLKHVQKLLEAQKPSQRSIEKTLRLLIESTLRTKVTETGQAVPSTSVTRMLRLPDDVIAAMEAAGISTFGRLIHIMLEHYGAKLGEPSRADAPSFETRVVTPVLARALSVAAPPATLVPAEPQLSPDEIATAKRILGEVAESLDQPLPAVLTPEGPIDPTTPEELALWARQEDGKQWSTIRQISAAPTPTKIRQVREKIGKTQAQFAQAAGLNRNVLSEYERGARTSLGMRCVIMRELLKQGADPKLFLDG